MQEDTKTYSQMRKEFYEKFKTVIIPTVMEYEDVRKRKLLLAITVSSALILVGIILAFLAAKNGGMFEKNNEGITKLGAIIFGAAFVSWYCIKKSFENTIKEKIMPIVCGCFGDFKWSCGSYPDGKFFSKSGVIPEYTSGSYDDIFTGCHKDTKIEIVESEYERGSGKNRQTVFNGVIIKLDMNKKFTSHTIIKPNGLFHQSPISGLHFTELEDVEFNKKFDVFTNDETDARYLITPTFMERLKNMETAFCANRVSCAFYDKFLIIALYTTKDLFSICSLVKTICDSNQYFKMYEEIMSIVKLIDHFKLSEKTGI